jgi:hypothetical protein
MQISKNVTIIDVGFHTMQISTTCNSSLKYYLIITNNCDRAVTEKGIFYLLELFRCLGKCRDTKLPCARTRCCLTIIILNAMVAVSIYRL